MAGEDETRPRGRAGSQTSPGKTTGGESSTSLGQTLDRVRDWVRRFVVFPSAHGATAVSLWIAFSHAVDEFDVAPYLLVTAPEIESGKTRVLEVAAPLCHHPMFSSSMTPAVLFRSLDRDHPTLFLDEADSIWSRRSDEKAQELVALLNAGHRRGVPARRMGGPGKTRLEEFDVFGPKAIAGAFPDIGTIPEALRSRSLHVRLKRKLPSESVDRWTRQTRESTADYLTDLRTALAKAVAEAKPGAQTVDPLDDIGDRDFDLWEPLLCIAQAAGGAWVHQAVEAAVALCAEETTGEVPLRILLLGDLRELGEVGELFQATHGHALTADIIDKLVGLEDRPWGDLHGSPITPHRLSRLLAGYGIESKFEPGPQRRKGYYKQDLEDLWARYTLSVPGEGSQSSPTSQEPEAFDFDGEVF